MSFEEWIGSLISLLAFAVLFFFNHRRDNEGGKDNKELDEIDDDEDEDPWKAYLREMGVRGEVHKKNSPPSLTKTSVQQPKVKKTTHSIVRQSFSENPNDEGADPAIRVSRLTPVLRVVRSYGLLERSRAENIVHALPSIRTAIICREILDRKN